MKIDFSKSMTGLKASPKKERMSPCSHLKYYVEGYERSAKGSQPDYHSTSTCEWNLRRGVAILGEIALRYIVQYGLALARGVN